MSRKLHILMVIILCIAGVALLNVGFLFFLLGFLPTVIAYFSDDSPHMDFYKTVRACNLAGMLPSISAVVRTDYPDAALQIAMNEPKTWLMVYGCAMIGWGLIWMCRWVSYLSILASSEAQAMLLERAQKERLEEWGEDLKHFVMSTE